MAANTSPIFVLSGNFTPARLTGSVTASNGSGGLVNIVLSGPSGSRVDGVRFRNSQVTLAASSAMVHRIFLTDVTGSNPRLIGEVATATATRSATAIGATSIYTFDQPITMAAGQSMSVCQSVYASAADQFDACAFAGSY
jgi:hypothetical protein